MEPPPRVEIARRRGRRIGIAVFGTLVSLITAIWALQIIRQVWFPAPEPAEVDCREGLRSLIDSVRRARGAAAAETGGERQALARFRSELTDTWRLRSAIGQACRSDAAATRALSEIDRWRFAEEHAVRYESVDLARRRRRVQSLESDLPAAGRAATP
jgi:hypothetical protein